MLLHAGMLLLGLVLLYFGAEWLVKGAAGLARAMGVRPLVVGLTVVAYGTSAPELVVSVLASLEGRSAIALGNVMGSNIANIGAILGVTALIHPPRVEATLIRRELPVLMASTLCIPLFLLDGRVSRLEGVLLLAGTVGFTFLTLRLARELRVEAPELREEVREEIQEEAAVGSRAALVGLSTVGLVGLVAGGKLFVDGASALALAFGMSERVVGLTIVAVGTSLPEMAASVVAALRGHSAIAIGNVVGSNIFNILLILGCAALTRPIEASLGELRMELGALLGFSLAAVLVMRGARHVSRLEGGLLAASYAMFLGVVAFM
ncbi:Inner membrane protein YrbG, putative calcium/sodium:proton antiporter [Cystobacter fuscus DSM 2262]|uniref:Inner membrane protein YrbG, putative calcium/sodium:proton antiporter n=1 Tax=Cystobacter fuscus (strain ATCC 25194 / DSM 2262 / NBRC 100088 / M29) TaxID=1242864 RepID=S9Q5Q4_CYSF2|nr:calcium/sodium antiporter [Cystobacter fuscus]EPX56629.1 Inner membrane protein YrbG, putative calcium/sodium:proton antiporter [Cystobacter fuscus DSM 2262]